MNEYMDELQQYLFVSLLFSCVLSSSWQKTLPALLPHALLLDLPNEAERY